MFRYESLALAEIGKLQYHFHATTQKTTDSGRDRGYPPFFDTIQLPWRLRMMTRLS